MDLTPLHLKANPANKTGILKHREKEAPKADHKRKASDPLYEHPRAAVRPRVMRKMKKPHRAGEEESTGAEGEGRTRGLLETSTSKQTWIVE